MERFEPVRVFSVFVNTTCAHNDFSYSYLPLTSSIPFSLSPSKLTPHPLLSPLLSLSSLPSFMSLLYHTLPFLSSSGPVQAAKVVVC